MEIQDPNGYDFSIENTICPDSNHPHAIDLGLPSGTLWACCNMGASSPEGYGGYYAWGETEEKNYYDWDIYKYWKDADGDDIVDSNEFVNIGSDIAGTSYDVAHVKWGGSWCMPSLTQIEELVNNCSSQWTQQNGVNGRLFTGPNGNSVFVPVAGCRCFENLHHEGSYGFYWSSSLSGSYPSAAYRLEFYSGYAGWYSCYYARYYGLTVRPVRKN